MNAFFIALRVVHICAAAFWAGSAFFLVAFVGPAAARAGAEGGAFMRRLTEQTRFPVAMAIAGAVTILSGFTLYGFESRFQPEWITSGTGLVFTCGGLAGIAAAALGAAVARPVGMRMGALKAEIQASGAPTPAQMTEMQSLRSRIARSSVWTAIMLAVALVAMSAARYV